LAAYGCKAFGLGPAVAFSYRFSIHKGDSTPVEGLGTVSLASDIEAATFAAQVIRDIKTGAHGRYDGWTMDITERGRGAGSVRFDSIEIPTG
jgi:hypothetical protein